MCSPGASPRLTSRSSRAASSSSAKRKWPCSSTRARVADLFGPGTHTIRTRNLPVLTDLRNWDKRFESPFKSDVYFFSTRLRLNQTWGTANPLTIRDREFGAVRLRGFGAYAYRIADPRLFFANVSGTRDAYAVADLEGQLRSTIISTLRITSARVRCPSWTWRPIRTSWRAR